MKIYLKNITLHFFRPFKWLRERRSSAFGSDKVRKFNSCGEDFTVEPTRCQLSRFGWQALDAFALRSWV